MIVSRPYTSPKNCLSATSDQLSSFLDSISTQHMGDPKGNETLASSTAIELDDSIFNEIPCQDLVDGEGWFESNFASDRSRGS